MASAADAGTVEEASEIPVRVAVRIRPLVPKERLEQCRSCVRVFVDERQVVVGKDRGFSFDFVFGEDSSQRLVFDNACAPLVQRCFQGYNATVFAYGQTGSGKTFTMGSSSTASVSAEELGVVPRVVSQVFDQLESMPPDAEWTVRVSYVEIYNEEVKDLLHPRTPAKSITIREDRAGDIFVLGVREAEASSREELLRCFEAGSASRTTRATLMNEMSSRSHSLFTIMIERRPDPTSDIVTSKFHLVDLAGSERNKKTGTAGARFKESITINQGLLALGNVISALGDETRRAQNHVPYRESKLTRLLQDSLGGNSHTLMIACVGPADSNLDETLNTLRYANRARNIRNKPVINREAPSVGDLRHEIQTLQWQLQQKQQPVAVPGVVPASHGACSHPGSEDVVPLSRRVLQVLKAELPAQQMERLVQSLTAIDAAGASATTTPETTPISTPAVSPMRGASMEPRTPPRTRGVDPTSPLGTCSADRAAAELRATRRGGGAVNDRGGASSTVSRSPLQQLRHTIQQWGRAEAQRAQLVGQLSQSQPHGDSRERRGDVGANEGALSVQGALKRAAERGQLLQALAVQQLGGVEQELEESTRDVVGADERPSTAPAMAQQDMEGRLQAAERTALRAMVTVREKELADVRTELIEAKADLSRDEQIFADKLRELKRLQKAHALLQREHATLQLQLQQPLQPPRTPPLPSASGPQPGEAALHPPRYGTPAWERTSPHSDTSTCAPRSALRSAQSPRRGSAVGSTATGSAPYSATGSVLSLEEVSLAVDPAEMSTRLVCSPARAFADELEALDDVLLDDEAGGGACREIGGHSEFLAMPGVGGGAGIVELERHEHELQRMDSERAQLERDEHDLRSQWSQAEAQTQALAMDFEEQQRRLEASVRDLTLNIRQKEQLIRDLSKAEEESRSVVGTYQHKLHQMSQEISLLQEELSLTRTEMESAERQAGRSEEQKQRLRQDYEKKLRETDRHLNEVRKRQNKQERALRSRELAERKMAELRLEVERMRGQEGSLREAIKSSRLQHEQRQVAREKEVSSLRKQMEEGARRVRALEQANARQERQLQRKSEQVNAVQQKLRIAQGGAPADRSTARAARRGCGGGGAPPTTRQSGGGAGAALSGSQDLRSASSPAVGSRGEAAAHPMASPASEPSAVDVQAQLEAAALEQQEEKLLRRDEAARELEMELARRESIVREKEALLVSRDGMELRSSHSLRSSIASLSRQLREVDAKLSREATKAAAKSFVGSGGGGSSGGCGDGGGGGGGSDGGSCGGSDGSGGRGGGCGKRSDGELSLETEALLRERAQVQELLADLELKGEVGGGALLDEAARTELIEFDERLESLSLQLDVKDSTIGELEQNLSQLASPYGESIRSQLNHMSLPVARRVLQANAHRMLKLREQQRTQERDLENLKLQLQEKAEESASLRQTLGQLVSEHEQQLEEQQRLTSLEVQQTMSVSNALRRTLNGLPAEAVSTVSCAASQRDTSGVPYSTPISQEAGGAASPTDSTDQLGRDNFYYKVSNRELRKRLKEEVEGKEAERRQLQDALQAASAEQTLNEQLQVEIQNLRSYLELHPGATPTKVSKRMLKQIEFDSDAERSAEAEAIGQDAHYLQPSAATT